MFIRSPESGFALPEDPATPIIMIGPGTGVAPFRGFIQARQALREAGQKLGAAHLYFGCRNPEQDYLYREEFEQAERRSGHPAYGFFEGRRCGEMLCPAFNDTRRSVIAVTARGRSANVHLRRRLPDGAGGGTNADPFLSGPTWRECRRSCRLAIRAGSVGTIRKRRLGRIITMTAGFVVLYISLRSSTVFMLR